MSGKRQIIHLFLLKTFCAQASCQNNGTCQSGFTRKRYRCLCASGFTGHDCEKGDTCVIEMNFLILSQWSISSEGSRFRISRTYDTYWIWPIVGEKKDGSTSPIFMLFFSTLVKRLVYDEQQRIQATFLTFWMPLSLFQRLSRLFEVAQTHPRLGIQCRKKWAKIFSSRQPLILLLTCFFTRQCWQIA